VRLLDVCVNFLLRIRASSRLCTTAAKPLEILCGPVCEKSH
jgi:hypothetical protein